PERPSFTLDPTFHSGAYYVQEASSMLISELVRRLMPTNRPWRMLDLCAAPGGKSCLLASIAPPGSVLISNEVIKARYRILQYNLAKWGYDNCWTTNLDPARFSGLANAFDLVLVDAPCSGEGLFRKDPKAREEWSIENVKLCAVRQKRILDAAVPLLAPEGLMLYSTCTYNEQENEQQVTYLSDQHGLYCEKVTLPTEWGIDQSEPGFRCYPHRVRGEGFFTVALRKQADTGKKFAIKAKKFPHWVPLSAAQQSLPRSYVAQPSHYEWYQNKHGFIYVLHKSQAEFARKVAQVLGRIDLGFPIGQVKGKQLVPAPELAFYTELSPSVPRFEVDHETALRLLKKDTPPLPDLAPGRHLITYKELGLLWVKGLGNRYNNNYPAAWRIRMNINLGNSS
ncbi:MAG: RNA methyltransferase, partial [Bacteroidota bacterium]